MIYARFQRLSQKRVKREFQLLHVCVSEITFSTQAAIKAAAADEQARRDRWVRGGICDWGHLAEHLFASEAKNTNTLELCC